MPNKLSGFTAAQVSVVYHEHAISYTRPTTGNILPFLVFEIKSEATGGTIFHAENQIVGSGTYTVRAVQWLCEQAEIEFDLVDSATFSVVYNARIVILYINWFSKQKQRYCLSKVRLFETMVGQHIQECHNIMKNINRMGERYSI